ncbi:tetratricopeptide repeat-containing sensor histidine kinase [Marixanthomonas spongiae]|uniref:histidine kinase n=1 Tax=Marixanthomonas spongiae TaxID=2174845 RepID=A0A2U0I7P8_9FLAO|nr:sensor histidine kinase [Marixanthomonas spongiae]PVW17118.1 two-component sensor histidine kinase [Marixanthomonas spongiae]
MKKVLSVVFLVTSIAFSQNRSEKLNDSAMVIYKSNPQKAVELLEKALSISEENETINAIAKSKNNLGIVKRDLGLFTEAKTLSQEALNISEDSIINASAYNNLGACNRNLGLYEEALTAYLMALKIYEAKNMSSEQATVTNNIGTVYSYLGMNKQAIENHLKAKDIFENADNKKGMSEVYNSIAIVYANDGDLNNALTYFKESLRLEEALNSPKGIAESTNNVGAVFYYMGEIDSALVYFNQSVKAERAIGNQTGIGATYNNIASVLIENDRLKEAKAYLDSGYYYTKKAKSVADIETALHNYSQYYEAKKQPQKALDYYKSFTVFKDSILNIATNSKVAELEIQYQTEKKENQILAQHAQLAEKELQVKQKNTIIYGSLGLAFLLGMLGYLLYNQQKLKNRQLKKEGELKTALAKIETQNRLQEQRLRISRDLHDNIGAQLTFIISSIDNLKFGLKNATLKTKEKLSSISEFTSQTIYELRDTIWAMNKEAITFEDLQARITNFINQASEASQDVEFTFYVSETISAQHTFTSVVGMNIYRIIQEAVNNALKYADATAIYVEISEDIDTFLIEVSDDGKGFNIAETELGNGLNNMKKRAREINGSMEYHAAADTGTQIILTVPKNPERKE